MYINNILNHNLCILRECYQHMHVTTLADITDASGTHLAKAARALQQPVYQSKFHFHLEPFTITKTHCRIWNEALNTITVSGGNVLSKPLGAWTTTPSTSRPYRLANGLLFAQHEDEQWYRHQLCNVQRSTRATYKQYSSIIFYSQQLPSSNIIVDGIIRGKLYVFKVTSWVMWPSLNIIIQEAPPLRAQWDMRGTSWHLNAS